MTVVHPSLNKTCISWQLLQDIDMYHEETDTPAMARTSNLNEELGQVSGHTCTQLSVCVTLGLYPALSETCERSKIIYRLNKTVGNTIRLQKQAACIVFLCMILFWMECKLLRTLPCTTAEWPRTKTLKALMLGVEQCVADFCQAVSFLPFRHTNWDIHCIKSNVLECCLKLL